MSIPKIIHQIWFQGEEYIPDHLKAYHQSWIVKNPTFKVKVWDEKTIQQEVDSFPDKDVRDMYTNYRYMIQKIDLAKYIILYKYGGIYIDMDTDCLQGISDEFLDANEIILSKLEFNILHNIAFALVGHNPTEDIINNGTIMVSPNNQIMLYTIEEGKKNKDSFFYYLNKTLYVFSSIGPICLTVATKKYKQEHPEAKIKILDETYFEACNIIQVKGDCKPPPHAIGLHLYESSWLSDTDKFLLNIYHFLAKYLLLILLFIFVLVYIFYLKPKKVFKKISFLKFLG